MEFKLQIRTICQSEAFAKHELHMRILHYRTTLLKSSGKFPMPSSILLLPASSPVVYCGVTLVAVLLAEEQGCCFRNNHKAITLGRHDSSPSLGLVNAKA